VGLGQALVMPALSFPNTCVTVKLAGVCEGGNSTSDWTISGNVGLSRNQRPGVFEEPVEVG
jgi:hypothetical protein